MNTGTHLISLRLLAFAGAALLGSSAARAQTTLLYDIDCNQMSNNTAANTYSGVAVLAARAITGTR